MSKRLFTSDWHLGHKAILKYRPQFNSIEEHDQAIFEQLASLKKRDIVWVLGDIIFDSDKYDYYVETLSKMSCEMRFILGNHDSQKLYRENRWNNISIQLPLLSYKNMWVTHTPIHPYEIRGRDIVVHGHMHNDYLKDDRYYNVNLDNNLFDFVDIWSIQHQIEHYKEYCRIEEEIRKGVNQCIF